MTFKISPVMCRAKGEARKRTAPAMSSAVAMRWSGYNWERVTDQYAELFRKLAGNPV